MHERSIDARQRSPAVNLSSLGRIALSPHQSVSLILYAADFDGVVFDFDDLLVGTQALGARPGFHLPLYGEALEKLIGRALGTEFKEALALRIGHAVSDGILPLIHRTLLEYGITEFERNHPEELGSMLEPFRRERILEAARRGECPLLRGAREIVKLLFEERKTLGIYTCNRRSINAPLMEIVFDHNLRSCFRSDLILFGDEVVALGGRRKPDPFGFLELSRRMGIAPERIIAFDDSCEGLSGALSAGYRYAVGVDGGKGTDFTPLETDGRVRVTSNLTARKK